MSDLESPDSFDKDYVKSLRAEAAKYRTELKDVRSELDQYKTLGTQINTVRIENELIRRGVTAQPEWVEFQEGLSPSQAVDNFLEKFPQFVGGVSEPEINVEHKKVPKAISSNPNKASKESGVPSGTLGTRSLEEIKEDPMARNNIRDLYRDLLRTSSNQKDN
jgi:hypothetical protein